ncbi:MAG: DUF5320 domain-containing protein [bacterium]
MPGGDRTGPLGAGPLTGRGAGLCRGYDAPGFANPGYGGGFRHGRGGGRGWRHRYYATGLPGWARGDFGYVPPAGAGYPLFESRMNARDELKMLRSEARSYEEASKKIEERIQELEKQRAADSKE